MKANRNNSTRESITRKLFFLLMVAILSPASLVCAQTNTTARTSSGGRRFTADARTRNKQVAITKEEQQDPSKPRKRPDGPGQMVDPNDGSNPSGTVVGSGTPIKRVISMTPSLIFSDPNLSSVFISVPGAQVTDLVMIGVPESVNGTFNFRAAVSADGQVKVTVHASKGAVPKPTQPILCRIVVIGF